MTAVGADCVRRFDLTAVLAAGECRLAQRVVRTPLSASAVGVFSFGKSHSFVISMYETGTARCTRPPVAECAGQVTPDATMQSFHSKG